MATDMIQEPSNNRNTSTAPMTGNQERHAANEPFPKMTTSDSKVNWKAFHLQFEERAVTYHWIEEVKIS